MIAILIISYLVYTIINWSLFIADWKVVTDNLSLYFIGSYPTDKSYRPIMWMVFLCVLSVTTIIAPNGYIKRRILTILWISIIPLGLILIAGGYGLEPVQTAKWGGITLTLILTICSGILSFPL